MKINRQSVYEKYNGHCAYCGERISFKEMQVDHIRAQARFRSGMRSEIPDYDVNDIRNLNPACRVCNYWKHDFSIEEFRGELSLQIERLRKYSGNFRIAERYGLLTVEVESIRFYFEKEKEAQ